MVDLVQRFGWIDVLLPDPFDGDLNGLVPIRCSGGPALNTFAATLVLQGSVRYDVAIAISLPVGSRVLRPLDPQFPDHAVRQNDRHRWEDSLVPFVA